MADFSILNLANKVKWKEYLQRLPIEQQDIYFTPEYYQIYETLGAGKAQCFIYEKEEEFAIYPSLINSINDLGYDLEEQHYDIQGAYGYNGVLTNSVSQTFFNSFFDCFDEYCRQNNIVTEFLRINPLLKDPLLFRTNFERILDQRNIYVNLLNENIFDKDYDYSTRKNIKKAIRSGLTFKAIPGNEISNSDLELFCNIYFHTMKRNNAEDFYYFDNNYFNNISTHLGEKALFAFVLLDSQVISCELILLGGKIAYSFLGGTLSDYYQYRPNELLKNETINLLKALGFHNFLLGGGSEGVFKYKKSFSKTGEIPFYIGKKIQNKNVYDEVVKQWAIKYQEKVEQYKNLVLKYRY